VVLDIGGNVGALILRAPAELCGEELELTPVDPSVTKVHTEVANGGWRSDRSTRRLPQLLAGEYEVDLTAQRVSVVGGQITEIDVSA